MQPILFEAFGGEELLAALFHALPVGVCITDQDGCLVYVNEAYCRIYGYEAEEMIGRSFLMVVPPEDRADLASLHDKLIHDYHEELPGHFPVVRKDGTVLKIRATAQGFTGRNGRRYKVTTVTDITEYMRLEKMRNDAERIVRHDLRSPLNGILGFSRLLLSENPRADQQREYAGFIYNGALQMLNLIDHSMDLFRMDEGTYQPRKELNDLGSVLEKIRKELSHALGSSRVDILFLSEGRDVQVVDGIIVQGETSLLYSMFSNLLRNAIESSPPHGTVTIDVVRKDGSVEVDMHNRGEIPPEIRERIFEKYTTSGKPSGTGLGAYSARLIARAHGGDIRFITSAEEGTHMIVTLPFMED